MSPKLKQFWSTRPKSFPSTLTVHVPVVGWRCCWLRLCRLFGVAVCWFSRTMPLAFLWRCRSLVFPNDAYCNVFAFGVAVRWFPRTMPLAMSLPLALPFAGFPACWRTRPLHGFFFALYITDVNSKFAMCLPPVYWRCRLARLNCSHA